MGALNGSGETDPKQRCFAFPGGWRSFCRIFWAGGGGFQTVRAVTVFASSTAGLTVLYHVRILPRATEFVPKFSIKISQNSKTDLSSYRMFKIGATNVYLRGGHSASIPAHDPFNSARWPGARAFRFERNAKERMYTSFPVSHSARRRVNRTREHTVQAARPACCTPFTP